MRVVAVVFATLAALLSWGCDNKAELSVRKARAHVEHLAGIVTADVEEVRRGLPAGAKHFVQLWKRDTPPKDDLKAVRTALEVNREKVQDLRVAKSTFFALADEKGVVLRNDQEEDQMAGKGLFSAFAGLKGALGGKYVETHGSMKEAAGVAEPRVDGQWVAASPVRVDSTVKGLYVTGWSWASYAYRLEFNLRGKIRADMLEAGEKTTNEPLVYVFVIVGKVVHGAPVSPDVSIETLAKEGLLEKAKGDAVHSQPIEITGREYGMAVKRTPALGNAVAVAVLRSET